jgi:hypothetical protein
MNFNDNELSELNQIDVKVKIEESDVDGSSDCSDLMDSNPILNSFNLKFPDLPVSKPFLRVRRSYKLQLSEEPLSGTFDIIVRRINYRDLPIQGPECPLKIVSQVSATYGPICFPKGSEVVHQGISVRFDQISEILIAFAQPSTCRTRDERDSKFIRMHHGKLLEIVFIDPISSMVMASIPCQAVAVDREQQRPVLRPATGMGEEEKAERAKMVKDLISFLRKNGNFIPLNDLKEYSVLAKAFLSRKA